MNTIQATKAIIDRWVALWPNVFPTTLYAAALPFVTQDEVLNEPPGAYARIINADDPESAQYTMGKVGARKHRRTGKIVIELNLTPDVGAAPNLEVGIGARDIFESTAIDGDPGVVGRVHCGAAALVPYGNDNRYHRIVVTIPYYYFETK